MGCCSEVLVLGIVVVTALDGCVEQGGKRVCMVALLQEAVKESLDLFCVC